MLVHNGGRGVEVFNNAADSAHATVYVTGNTLWGNNTDPNQKGPCGDLMLGPAKGTVVDNNAIVATGTGGCGTQGSYAILGYSLDATDQIYGNADSSPSQQNALVEGSPAFAFQNGNTAIDPGFAAPQVPAAPDCSGLTNSVACMRSVIADFAITNSAITTLGYQLPGNSSVQNPLYPTWLCKVQVPSGIDNFRCSSP
jgi:hypothetical protein